MIDRYTLPRMKAIWDLRRKYEIWLEVELAACEACERNGEVPKGTARRIRKKARILRSLAPSVNDPSEPK